MFLCVFWDGYFVFKRVLFCKGAVFKGCRFKGVVLRVLFKGCCWKGVVFC